MINIRAFQATDRLPILPVLELASGLLVGYVFLVGT